MEENSGHVIHREISNDISENGPSNESSFFHKNKSYKYRNLIAFWIFGLANNFGFVIINSAGKDILTPPNTTVSNITLNNVGHLIPYCNPIGTGAILLAIVIPGAIIKLISPFFVYYLTYNFKISMILLSSFVGTLLVAFGGNQILIMTFSGIMISSIMSSFGEMVFLSLSSFFILNVVSTWGSGTGAAGLFGSLSYAGLTFLGIPPKFSILMMPLVPFILVLTYFVILVHPNEIKKGFICATNYMDESEPLLEDNTNLTKDLTYKEQILLIKPLLKYIIPLFLIYFIVYLINQSLYEIIMFQNCWINEIQQYRWYQFTYQLGVFISRSSVNLIHISHIWIFMILEAIIFAVLLSLLLTQHLTSIWIIFGLIFLEGIFCGAAYVNTFYNISKTVERKYIEFSIGITTNADSLGVVLAAVVSLYVRNAVCEL